MDRSVGSPWTRSVVGSADRGSVFSGYPFSEWLKKTLCRTLQPAQVALTKKTRETKLKSTKKRIFTVLKDVY